MPIRSLKKMNPVRVHSIKKCHTFTDQIDLHHLTDHRVDGHQPKRGETYPILLSCAKKTAFGLINKWAVLVGCL